MIFRTCTCGSGREKYAKYDARNIFLCYVCSKCEDERMKGYRVEVLEDAQYEADEDIDGDGWDGDEA